MCWRRLRSCTCFTSWPSIRIWEEARRGRESTCRGLSRRPSSHPSEVRNTKKNGAHAELAVLHGGMAGEQIRVLAPTGELPTLPLLASKKRYTKRSTVDFPARRTEEPSECPRALVVGVACRRTVPSTRVVPAVALQAESILVALRAPKARDSLDGASSHTNDPHMQRSFSLTDNSAETGPKASLHVPLPLLPTIARLRPPGTSRDTLSKIWRPLYLPPHSGKGTYWAAHSLRQRLQLVTGHRAVVWHYSRRPDHPRQRALQG